MAQAEFPKTTVQYACSLGSDSRGLSGRPLLCGQDTGALGHVRPFNGHRLVLTRSTASYGKWRLSRAQCAPRAWASVGFVVPTPRPKRQRPPIENDQATRKTTHQYESYVGRKRGNKPKAMQPSNGRHDKDRLVGIGDSKISPSRLWYRRKQSSRIRKKVVFLSLALRSACKCWGRILSR